MWIILIIIAVFFLLKYNSIESFYGMNYIQQHNYLKCCNNLGCRHPICKKYISVNRRKLELVGILYKFKGNNSLFSQSKNNKIKLFIRYGINQNSYYIKILNRRNRFVYSKLSINKDLTNDSIIKLNNVKYRVYLNNYNKYNPLFRNKYFKYDDSIYQGDSYAYKYGYLKPQNLNSSEYLSLYRKKSGSKIDYYMNNNNKLVHLDKYKNSLLKNGDKINFLNYDKKKYVYELVN
jgi:hypothetical protein